MRPAGGVLRPQQLRATCMAEQPPATAKEHRNAASAEVAGAQAGCGDRMQRQGGQAARCAEVKSLRTKCAAAGLSHGARCHGIHDLVNLSLHSAASRAYAAGALLVGTHAG